jgi:hypothetical protein
LSTVLPESRNQYNSKLEELSDRLIETETNNEYLKKEIIDLRQKSIGTPKQNSTAMRSGSLGGVRTPHYLTTKHSTLDSSKRISAHNCRANKGSFIINQILE